MATNKTVTVTTAPTKTGDTLANYKIYTNQSGTALATITPAQGLAGYVVSLTDGLNHSITVKAVWTTGGESTLSSNAVSVDLTTPTNYGLVLGTADKNVLEVPYQTLLEYEWKVKNMGTAGLATGCMFNNPNAVDSITGFIGLRGDTAAAQIYLKGTGTITAGGAKTLVNGDRINLHRLAGGGKWYINDILQNDYPAVTGYADLTNKAAFGGYKIADANYRRDFTLYDLRIRSNGGTWETFSFASPTTISTSKVSFTGSLGTVIELGSNAPAVDIHAAIVTV